MCGAPRSCTSTGTVGQRRTSEPVAPAWSKWMWVSRIARGSKPSPSSASSVSCVRPGPGSIRTPSTSQQQMTFSRPLCRTSIARMAAESTVGSIERDADVTLVDSRVNTVRA